MSLQSTINTQHFEGNIQDPCYSLVVLMLTTLEMSRGENLHPMLASISRTLCVSFSVLYEEKARRQAPAVAEVADPSRTFLQNMSPAPRMLA